MIEELDLSNKIWALFKQIPAYDIVKSIMIEFDNLDIYLAGGSLRNIIMGIKNQKDLDLFFGGESVENAITRFKEHGVLKRNPFGNERWFSLTYNNIYCDLIPIQKFINGLWRCKDIVDTLNQFDFTANAMAVDLRNGKFYNPQNGLRDLLNKEMRAVRFDYPEEPIFPGQTLTRNQVLWFRILHYAAALDFKIEPITMRWLIINRKFSEFVELFNKNFFPIHPMAFEKLTK